MEIIQLFVILGVLGLIIYCSSRMAKKVSAPLKERGSRWALTAGIGAFVLSFSLFTIGVLLVFALTFGR
jgi:hypothetical protein